MKKNYYLHAQPIWLKILQWAWIDGAALLAISCGIHAIAPYFIDWIIAALTFTIGAFLVWLAAAYIWSSYE